MELNKYFNCCSGAHWAPFFCRGAHIMPSLTLWYNGPFYDIINSGKRGDIMLKSLKLMNLVNTKNDMPQEEQWLKLLFCTTQKNDTNRNSTDITNITNTYT